MAKLHVITPDENPPLICDFPDTFEHSRDRKLMQEIVEGDIEFVWVKYNGKRTCMIVNEIGAVMSPPLPVNRLATEIYHTYPAGREGLTMAQAWHQYPKIHGTVALLENVTVP